MQRGRGLRDGGRRGGTEEQGDISRIRCFVYMYKFFIMNIIIVYYKKVLIKIKTKNHFPIEIKEKVGARKLWPDYVGAH